MNIICTNAFRRASDDASQIANEYAAKVCKMVPVGNFLYAYDEAYWGEYQRLMNSTFWKNSARKELQLRKVRFSRGGAVVLCKGTGLLVAHKWIFNNR